MHLAYHSQRRAQPKRAKGGLRVSDRGAPECHWENKFKPRYWRGFGYWGGRLAREAYFRELMLSSVFEEEGEMFTNMSVFAVPPKLSFHRGILTMSVEA